MDEVDGDRFYKRSYNKPDHLDLANNRDDKANGNQTNLTTNSTGTQTPETTIPDDILQDARALAMDIVHYIGSNNTYRTSCSKRTAKTCKTLKRTVDELLEKHSILFKGMVEKLNITQTNGYQTFVNVADEIFLDGQINWGRIVAVYAFGGRLARYSVERNMPDFVDKIGFFVGDYVADKLGWWIYEQGGWEGFQEYFPEPDGFEKSIWKGLLVTAVGLGALATMVAAR